MIKLDVFEKGDPRAAFNRIYINTALLNVVYALLVDEVKSSWPKLNLKNWEPVSQPFNKTETETQAVRFTGNRSIAFGFRTDLFKSMD